MKSQTRAGRLRTVLGVLALVSLVMGNGAEPAAVDGAKTQNSLSNTPPEQVPPGALSWRGPSTPQSPGTNSANAIPVLPATLKLPPDVAEIVRLQAAKVGDEVILAHIQNSPPLSPITADQVVYLKDLGISPRVLAALLQHQAALGDSAAASEQSDETPPTDYAESVPPAADEEEASLPGPLYFNPVDYGYIYNALSPYGTWLDLPGFGWSWQPLAGALNPAWRPYCDGGRWRWSDCGWYWHSSYSWGWGPFHYGRWSQHSGYGWVWHPDRVWAPAWVAWRNSKDACGWAPLPPGTDFTLASGWTSHGQPVNTQRPDFGLPASSFIFVAKDQFLSRAQRPVSSQQASQLFVRSRPAERNGFRVEANSRVVNSGIDPTQVQAATHAALQPAVVGVGFAGRVGPAGRFAPSQAELKPGLRSHPGGSPRSDMASAAGISSTADAWAVAAWTGLGQSPDRRVPQYPVTHAPATVPGGRPSPWTQVQGPARSNPWHSHDSGTPSGGRVVYPFGKPAGAVAGGGAVGGGAVAGHAVGGGAAVGGAAAGGHR